MRVCLFEDRGVAALAPFAVARPGFEMLCGLGRLHDGIIRHFQPDSLGYLIRWSHAAAFRQREPHAPVNDPLWLRGAPTWMVNSRWIPGKTFARPNARSPFLATCGGEIAYALLSADQLAGVAPDSLENCFDDWRELLPTFEVDGCVATSAADLLTHSYERIAADFPHGELCPNLPAGVALVGRPEQLHIDLTATVEPMVLLDTTRGPIVIGAGARVRAFSRIEGPCVVGTGSDILGATLRGATVGPKCRIAGTLENAVVQGFADIGPGCAFSGAYLGEGVIAGPNVVCESTGAGPILVGDFTRLGAGVILDRATTVGSFSRVWATGWSAPHNVQSFGIVHRDGVEPDERANKHLHEIVAEMASKGRVLDGGEIELYRALASAGSDFGHRTLPLPFRRAG